MSKATAVVAVELTEMELRAVSSEAGHYWSSYTRDGHLEAAWRRAVNKLRKAAQTTELPPYRRKRARRQDTTN